MQVLKNDFSGGLDLDSSPYRVAENSYVDALNITKNAVEGGSDLVITNSVGNRVVNYALLSGRNKCIGAFPFTLRNTIIYFIWNENDFHSILEYDNTTRTISPIFVNLVDSTEDVLGFLEDVKIYGVNVLPRGEGEGDLLYFLDSLRRPTGLNIMRFKNGEYTPVSRHILDVAKRPPLSPPSNVFGNDTTRRANNFRKKLVRFKTRFEYDDFEKSTCSPIGEVPLPVNILSDTYTNVITNNNVIYLSFRTGDKNVKKVELLMSYAEGTNDWSDFMLVDSIDKSKLSIQAATNVYNDGTTGLAAINFTGTYITGGDQFDIYITELPSTQILLGSYTAIDGDTVDTIISGLISSIALSPTGITAYTNGEGGLFFNFDNTIYNFDRLDTVISNPNVDNTIIPYSFYNDSTYPVIDVFESIQLFDTVPEKANDQELVNGNVLSYWGITEGYDNDLVPQVGVTVGTVAAGDGSGTGSLSVVSTRLGVSTFIFRQYQASFSGIPAVGTVVTIKLRRLSDNAIIDIATYTSVAGNSAEDVINGITASMTAIGIAVFYNRGTGYFRYYYDLRDYEYSTTEVVPPVLSATANSIATFPFSTERRLALAYFDDKGKTNGVVYDTKVTFPAYAENGSEQVLLPYINAKIYHTPPEWAYSYQWLMTKDDSFFLYWLTKGVNVQEANYIYFDVSNFGLNAKKFPSTAEVLSYTFKDGDRLRLIRNDTTNAVFSDAYDAAIEGMITNPNINGVDKVGTFIKIKKVTPFTSGMFTSDFFVIQIYRPSQQLANTDNQVYYEFGEERRIINPTLPTRYHAGGVTDQDFSTSTPAEFLFYRGDAYFRQRNIVTQESGTATAATVNVIDRNFVDFYISAVSSIDGRPNIIDTNTRRAYYPAMVRFGQAYQPNTNINGLNRFYPNNFDEYDLSAGDIMRVRVRDRYVRVFQKYKVGTVPIFNQISKNADGTQLLVVTDKLLNPIQYYAGNKGIGNQPESLASFNFADYFSTDVVGEICRLSNDGITPISVVYRVNSWANEKLPLRTGVFKSYGAFDQKLNKYILALEATEGDAAATIMFDEGANSFDGFSSLQPEMMTTIGTLLVAFKDGALWTHDATTYNNFFGVQYDSSVTPVINKGVGATKSFMAIEERANSVWDCPEIETSMMSYGTTPQQSNLVASDFDTVEGKFVAHFLRDSNSINGINDGDQLKGDWMKIKLRNASANNLVTLNILGVRVVDSPLNNR